MAYVIGVDGGGSGCRAAIADLSGRIVGRGMDGPANVMTDIESACRNVLAAARQSCRDAGLDPGLVEDSAAVVALAGVNIPGWKDEVHKRLPFRAVSVETDALVALIGALGPHDGAVAVLGTGSVFAMRTGAGVRMVGGWGFMVGDLASGACLGRALLQETLLAYDAIHRSSPLTDAVMRRFGGDPNAIVSFAAKARPGDFGQFAPLLFDHCEQGDPVAADLVGTALEQLEETLDAIMTPDCDRLCLLGGLAHRYRAMLPDRLRKIVHDPLGDGLDGALFLARSRFGPGAGGHD